MRGPIIALIGGIIIVVAAAAVALLNLSAPPQAPPVPSPTPPPSGETTSGGAQVQYNQQLADKGKQYFQSLGCVACHSIKSLGISGGAVGPDLSKALLGNPGVAGSVIGRYFKENGLANPASDPQKAAALLEQYLTEPPDYSGTMKTQVKGYEAANPNWKSEIVPALVEMLKAAAARS